ncbi:hypothetical protein GC105_09735 [Alkalibaculum sp. M08DMB]|uniref:Heme NO-binding domain-containing protein n=1 Tax=Alkalibaculum sporogenes TaxID=2655001 RepID=A0A6A7K9T6_9FIRM|nr:heme NO-binding domain-containing protein [Alkalibaculum sporogenes]MPW26071.1 hypothetical protein [Alkalibaculum sporogenes]
MKGTVVSTWLKSLSNLFSSEIVDNALLYINWDKDSIINPFEEIPDDEIFKVIASMTNEFVEHFGQM